jgi:hypothetical protein
MSKGHLNGTAKMDKTVGTMVSLLTLMNTDCLVHDLVIY